VTVCRGPLIVDPGFQVSETSLYEVMQKLRRRTTTWLRVQRPWALDAICESCVQVVAGDGLRWQGAGPPPREWGFLPGSAQQGRAQNRFVLLGGRSASAEGREVSVLLAGGGD
jgi:hypothetical protein